MFLNLLLFRDGSSTKYFFIFVCKLHDVSLGNRCFVIVVHTHICVSPSVKISTP